MQKANNCPDSYPMLLDTDQLICYNEIGDEIPCDGTGQDGEHNSKLKALETRFVPRKNVVNDRLTGLVWTRKAAPDEFPMTWAEAFNYVSELNRLSYLEINQWRLPSRRELYSLISHRYINPALPQVHPFTDVFSGYYWTATHSSRLMNQAWYIHLGGGRIYRGMKEGSYLVWPVTGSWVNEFSMPHRFQWANGILEDRMTKRMWQMPVDHLAQQATWEGAFEIIEKLNAQRVGGYGDWRLPNIRELESLVDLNLHSPALPESITQNSVAEGYWSATTSAFEKRYAWVLYTRDGAIGVGYKRLSDFCVWAIRHRTR